MTITPAEIRQGDILLNNGTVGWVAQQDATVSTPGWGDLAIEVQVQFPDGGIDYRFWPEDTTVRFTVTDEADGRRLTIV